MSKLFNYGGINMVYVHIGSKKFNKKKFKTVENFPFKPIGGFWCSPFYCKTSWLNYLTHEFLISNAKGRRRIIKKLNKFFIFKLNDNAKIYHIYSKEDVDRIPRCSDTYNPEISVFDFERMIKEGYDGVELHISSNEDVLSYEMCHWDVDSLLIFNPEIIEVI